MEDRAVYVVAAGLIALAVVIALCTEGATIFTHLP